MLLAHDQIVQALPASPPAAPPRIEIRPMREMPPEWTDGWDRLAGHPSEANVFAERWFAEASLNLEPPDDARMMAVWAGDRLIGLLPLATAHRYGRTPVAHVENWLHHHAFLGTPLIAPGQERVFWTAVLEALDQADWAPGFLHMVGLVENGTVHRGLVAAAAALDRPCDVVHRSERAFLESHLAAKDYYEQAVRKKKRKEIGRLTARLREQGDLAFRTYWPSDDLETWIDDFLALEAKGWKGKAGSALGCHPTTDAFFRAAVKGAEAAVRLQFLRLDLDGRAIAMLVTFMAPPGAFTFKIAFDEDFARFSPGVLLQLEYLKVLERDDIAWSDSCAIEDHPMINSLWMERRSVVRVTVPLSGARRRAIHAACRGLETGSALLRRLISRKESDQ